MKKVFFMAFLFYALNGIAMDSTRLALMFNLAQLPYQCYELNGLVNLNSKFQVLAALNLTNGTTNRNQDRNKVAFREEFMKKAPDKIQGMGFGLQGRYKIKENNSGRFKVFCGLGFNYYNYKLTFYENEYVEDQPPFYHFTLVDHKEKFNRFSTDAQVIYNYSGDFLVVDLGIGLAYNKSRIPESMENYRNYHLNAFDYGYTGVSPIFSLRVGFWLF